MHKELFTKLIAECKKGIEFHSMMYKWSNAKGFRGMRRIHWYNEMCDHHKLKSIEEFILNSDYDFTYLECNDKLEDTKKQSIRSAKSYKEALVLYYDYECEVYDCIKDIAYKMNEDGDILASKFILDILEEVKCEKVNVKKSITYLNNGEWYMPFVMDFDKQMHDKFKKEHNK